MKIANLSQLKRAFAAGHDFEIVEQYIKPEHTGEIRRVNVLQTNGMYTHVVGGKLDNAEMVNAWNYGKGSWIDFGKAGDWTFCDDLCTFAFRGRKIWTIRILDSAA